MREESTYAHLNQKKSVMKKTDIKISYSAPSKTTWLFSFFFTFAAPCHCFYDVSIPYHARFFPGEPRIAKKHITSFDLRVAGTTEAQHRCCKPQELLATSSHAIILSCTHNPNKYCFVSFTLPFYHIHNEAIIPPELEKKYIYDYSAKELGISALTTGLTFCFDKNPDLDFIDVAVETGILLPPSAHRKTGCGILSKVAASTGIFDWLTIGLEADAATFFDIYGGTQYNIGWFLEADHLIRGFSFLLGYSYSRQEPMYYIWHNIVLDRWDMSTLHLSISYDLAREKYPGLPHLEFFYNRLLNGTNVTGNSLVGITIGTTF